MQTSETVHPDFVHGAAQVDDCTTIGNVTDIQMTDGIVRLYCNHGQVVICFPTDSILRFKAGKQESLSLDSSIAVVRRESNVEPVLERHEDVLILRTNALQVTVGLAPFAIEIVTVHGNLVYRMASLAAGETGWVCRSSSSPDAHFYGLGEKTGFLDKQGESYAMWNSDVYDPHVPEIDAMYVSIPFLIHFERGRASGFFLDNPGKSRFDMRSHADTYDIWAATGDFDAYVFGGGTVEDVIGQYTSLTGRTSLPPKWAIGYHQSRYSYMSQAEVLDVAHTFRAKGIPCDAIYLDIHYMDGYRVFTFDKVRFPNPAALTQQLREMGIRLVTIVDPGVKQDPDYAAYNDGLAENVFCEKPDGEVFIGDVWPGPSAFPDFTDTHASEWWANRQKFYADYGVSGIWNDMNEPAVFNDSKTMELDIVHRNDGNPQAHESLHNLYGMLMCKATRAGLQEHSQNTRPFVLTRAGYAGIQRYAAVWTGDNRSYWEHLAMSVPMLLNLGMSGVPFSGVDIGGFAHHASGDLLARWTQVGVFFPFCRNHSALDTLCQEPWSFGPDIEEICRKYISLRYRWLPHFYSLFRSSAETGLPWMRPLVLEYPDDPQTYRLCDQFLVGKDVLVAPVYRPDMDHRAVYLPAGIWYDYWTGQVHQGGRHILAAAPLDVMPLFIRAGAILPEQNVVQSTAVRPVGPLSINLYAGGFAGRTSYSLYDDDGETLACEEGAYSMLDFTLHGSDETVVCEYTYRHNGFPSPYNGWLFRFKGITTCPVGVDGLAPQSRKSLFAGTEGWTYDEKEREVIVAKHSLGQTGEIVVRI